MSAELPISSDSENQAPLIFDSQVTRREFIFNPLKKAGAVYLAAQFASLAAACDFQEESLDEDIILWNFEYEEDTVYFFAQNLTTPKDVFFAHLGREKLVIYALYEGDKAMVKVFDGEYCQILNEGWVAEFLSSSDITLAQGLCDKLFPIVRGLVVDAISREGTKIPDLSFQTIKEGSLVLDDDLALIAKGKRYLVSPDSAEILTTPKITGVPKQFVEQIPESENKLNFRLGDILVDSRGKRWFLQNGGRYEIRGSVRGFMQSRHKKMRVFEVPNWAIDKVPARELPNRFFKDQHNRQIDGNSDRLLVLWGGLGSTSQSTMKDFGPLVDAFLANGGRESQVLFGTFNTRIVGNGFVPEMYGQEYSLGYPPTAIERAKDFYKWLKLKAPLVQVVSCGHSQGGVVSFYAGLAYPDMHSRVITVNAPLVGVDRTLISIGPFEFEDLAFFRGCESRPIDDWCESLRHYVAEGDSPTLRDNVENWAKLILSRGVELVNFSAKQDPLVGTDRAILKNSTSSINGREIQRVWDIPGAMIGNRSPHGRILDHRPFLLEVIKFIGRP